MSNDSQESPMSSRHRFYPSVLTQMQIERLKREDDEEHWISGEELYTEGSSEDEEDQRLIVIRDPEFIENEDNICPNVTIGGERERLAISPTICSRLKSNRKNHGVLRPRSIPVRDRNIAAEAEERVRVDNESDSVASGSSSSSAVMAAAIVSSVEDEEISSISSCKETSSAVMGTNQCAENRGENFSAVTAEHAGDGDEDGEEISWRPKRGSSLLPKLNKSEPAGVDTE